MQKEQVPNIKTDDICGAGEKTLQTLQSLQDEDPGSQVAFQFDKEAMLETVHFQTSLMTKVFMKFPEVLLIIRSHNDIGKVLYTFVADGPHLGTGYEMVKIVHVAVPKNETPEGMADMFTVLKDFNPSWSKIRIFLVDTHFKGTSDISKAFPSAEVVRSAFHVCKYIQEKIYQLSLPEKTEELLVNALKNTLCTATDGNLRKMHVILHQFVKPDVVKQLKPNLLLVDRIWALHRWRSRHDCFLYFQKMEAISREFSQIFNKYRSVESNFTILAKYIKEQTSSCGVPEMRVCSVQDMALLNGKQWPQVTIGLPANIITNIENRKECEAAELICQSLDRICIPAASDLCKKELSAAQKSVPLIGSKEDIVNIQMLEHPHEVNWESPKKCTCHFNQCLKLPCRHILAVLNADKEVLKPEMFDSSWQKQSNGFENILPVPVDTLEIMKGDAKELPEKQMRVDIITNKITQLLTQCSDEVFQRRYTTLRDLADAWIGPYEQVKL
ncbi:zinc finger SWIM domain-containing protein 1 [Rhinophrynus dorsalis]